MTTERRPSTAVRQHHRGHGVCHDDRHGHDLQQVHSAKGQTAAWRLARRTVWTGAAATGTAARRPQPSAVPSLPELADRRWRQLPVRKPRKCCFVWARKDRWMALMCHLMSGETIRMRVVPMTRGFAGCKDVSGIATHDETRTLQCP